MKEDENSVTRKSAEFLCCNTCAPHIEKATKRLLNQLARVMDEESMPLAGDLLRQVADNLEIIDTENPDE